MLEAFVIVVIHYIADFVFQDGEWAVNKSKSLKALLKHTATYSLIWFVISLILIQLNLLPQSFYLFALITFILHTITDYFTSKITSKMYENQNFGSRIPVFGFFSMIGFDQVLHYGQLFLTYYLLIKL